MGPILGPCHQSVFHRIVMNVIQVSLEILFISDDVIPEALLPELHPARDAQRLFIGLGEIGFEGMHNLTKVAASRRLDEQVEVVV